MLTAEFRLLMRKMKRERLSYNLSVVPVSRVDGIKITKYQGPDGTDGVVYESYPDDGKQNWVYIIGMAYYTNDGGSITGAANVKLKITVVNTSWEELGKTDRSTTYATTVSRDDGFFFRTVNINRGLGSTQGDIMRVEISPLYDSQKKFLGSFRLERRYT